MTKAERMILKQKIAVAEAQGKNLEAMLAVFKASKVVPLEAFKR